MENILMLKGSPRDIGLKHGKTLKKGILKNVDVLVNRVHEEGGIRAVPLEDKDFMAWEKKQAKIMKRLAPWLLEEMEAIAEGAGAEFRHIMLLSLRAWQYKIYNDRTHNCSSFAMTLKDKTVATAGALDDGLDYYCGPVHIVPDKGYSFLSFPITGTVWGNRGMNNQGLAAGISSQLLGLPKPPEGLINQDIAMRIILQTCKTVGEVRSFCKKNPFTMNLICVDSKGGIFCANQTLAGLYEYPAKEGYAAMTNHVIDDRVIYDLEEKGVRRYPESKTTRARRGSLLAFAQKFNGKCSGKKVMDLIHDRKDGNPWAICHKRTLALSYANPQKYKDTIWINWLGADKEKTGFSPVKL